MRQVEQDDVRRAEGHEPGQRGWSRIAGRQVIGGAVLADGFDAPTIGICDGNKAQLDLATIVLEPDHVGWAESQPRGRQAEGGVVLPTPRQFTANRARRAAQKLPDLPLAFGEETVLSTRNAVGWAADGIPRMTFDAVRKMRCGT